MAALLTEPEPTIPLLEALVYHGFDSRVPLGVDSVVRDAPQVMCPYPGRPACPRRFPQRVGVSGGASMMAGFGLVLHGEVWTITNNHIQAGGQPIHLYPPPGGDGVLEGYNISEDGLIPLDGYENPRFNGSWSTT